MSENRISRTASDRTILLILICFFLSGLTGLTYEILWIRMIVKIIGGAPFAVSIILTVFMGGLGLGSYLAGRFIDRVEGAGNLVRIYGILEIIIGAYGLLLPVLLTAFRPVYSILYNRLFDHFMIYSLLTFAGCALLLCVPVICMGATLPILCRFYITRLSHLGTHAGRLYGLNTIGAAAGSLLCGFWLLNLSGVWGTLIFAITINIVIGLACIRAGGKSGGGPDPAGKSAVKTLPEEEAGASEGIEPPRAVNGALVIFAVSGFCAMACEVIWTRLLGLIVGPTTYSFTIVLVTFILGLALGSIIFGRVADISRRPVWVLIITQIAAALLVLLISQVLGSSQFFFAKVIYLFREDFALLSLVKALILFGFMILPTLCFGATFPLVGKIYTRSVAGVGRSIGFVYAINTIGAVLGSFCAGFILIPLIGKENGLRLVAGLQLLSSLAVAGILLYSGRKRFLRLAPLALTVIVGLGLCLYFPRWNHRLLATSKYHRFDWIEGEVKLSNWLEAFLKGSQILSQFEWGDLVYYGDGIGGFTTVIRNFDAMGNLDLTMANSGKADASTRGDMETQTLSAHFPMLFHKDPKRVMVLGLASGITAGDVLCYPVDKLDVIDINEQVVRASDLFRPWNNDVLYDSHTNLIIQDGRAHLNLTREKYDVIISEPSNPWMAGLAALFTLDFFELARDRLNEDGIFVQFIHSYEMDWATFALVGRTFASVFPNSLLILTEPSGAGSDFLLVGFRGEEGLSLENSKKNFPFTRNSKNLSLSDPAMLYRLIVSEDLEGLFGPGPVNTDSRPLLEFSAPKLIHKKNDSDITGKIQSEKWLRPKTREIVKQIMTDVDAQIGFAAYALSVYSPFRNMVDPSNAASSQKVRYFNLLEKYYSSNPLDLPLDTSLLNDLNLMQRFTVIQINNLQDNIDNMPDRALSYTYLGRHYLSENMIDKAVESFNESLKISSVQQAGGDYNSYKLDVLTLNDLGGALSMQGRLDEAIKCFNESLRINPNYAEAHINIGNILMAQEKLNRAINHFRDALEINPYYETAYIKLGAALARQEKFKDAVNAYNKAIMLNPENGETHKELGFLLALQNKSDEAIIHLEKSLKINPHLVDSHVALGNIFIQRDKFDKAEMHYNEALNKRPETASIFANILLDKGRPGEALKYLKKALQFEPHNAETINNLAWILATHKNKSIRDPDEAIRLSKNACELSDYKKPVFLDTLAVSYAAAGRFSEAVNAAEKAMESAKSSQQEQLGMEIQRHLELFRSGLPFIEINS